jgi:hypothetical protein
MKNGAFLQHVEWMFASGVGIINRVLLLRTEKMSRLIGIHFEQRARKQGGNLKVRPMTDKRGKEA